MLDMDIYEQENEHDIKELNEHPNVYFVYSEDGLIREEEVAPKKNKQKKQQETKKE
jgi:kinesin family protein 3/17